MRRLRSFKTCLFKSQNGPRGPEDHHQFPQDTRTKKGENNFLPRRKRRRGYIHEEPDKLSGFYSTRTCSHRTRSKRWQHHHSHPCRFPTGPPACDKFLAVIIKPPCEKALVKFPTNRCAWVSYFSDNNPTFLHKYNNVRKSGKPQLIGLAKPDYRQAIECWNRIISLDAPTRSSEDLAT